MTQRSFAPDIGTAPPETVVLWVSELCLTVSPDLIDAINARLDACIAAGKLSPALAAARRLRPGGFVHWSLEPDVRAITFGTRRLMRRFESITRRRP